MGYTPTSARLLVYIGSPERAAKEGEDPSKLPSKLCDVPMGGYVGDPPPPAEAVLAVPIAPRVLLLADSRTGARLFLLLGSHFSLLVDPTTPPGYQADFVIPNDATAPLLDQTVERQMRAAAQREAEAIAEPGAGAEAEAPQFVTRFVLVDLYKAHRLIAHRRLEAQKDEQGNPVREADGKIVMVTKTVLKDNLHHAVVLRDRNNRLVRYWHTHHRVPKAPTRERGPHLGRPEEYETGPVPPTKTRPKRSRPPR